MNELDVVEHFFDSIGANCLAESGKLKTTIVVECGGCHERRIVKAPEQSQAVTVLSRSGWVTSEANGWLCPTCANDVQSVFDLESDEWTLVLDKEMMISLLTEYETDAAFRAYAGFKIKLSPEAVEVVEGFVSMGAWD